MALGPAGADPGRQLVGLTGQDPDEYVKIGCHPLWQPVISVVVSCCWFFFLIAGRNYLRGPVDD